MSENKFKRTFTLKQHTPLIHFQHTQDGATLRATELKPKLDRFLIQKLRDNGINPKPFLIGSGDKEALDYKVSIKIRIYYDDDLIPEVVTMEEYKKRNGRVEQKNSRGKPAFFSNKKPIPKIKNQFPLFFGNMMEHNSNENDVKRFVIHDKIDVNFFSFNTELINYIEQYFESFLMKTNFGTRQSKGFGSFYIDGKEPIPTKYWFPVGVSFVNDDFVRTPQKIEYKKYFYLFDTIEIFYKTLRSGINLKDRNRNTTFYFKSLMFLYAKNYLNAQWDKKSVKDKFYSQHSDMRRQMRTYTDKDSPVKYRNGNQLLVRDLLGLSSDQQWQSYGDNISKESTHKEKEQPAYARMQSPIFFKPIRISEDRFKVYFDFDESVLKEILGKEFVIRSKKNHGSLKLSFPKEFSFAHFFDWIFNPKNLDLEEHIDMDFQEKEYFYIIDDIFKDIRKNLGYEQD